MSILKILHLEDDSGDASLAEATLAAHSLAAEIVRVDSRAAFEAALNQGSAGALGILADHIEHGARQK